MRNVQTGITSRKQYRRRAGFQRLAARLMIFITGMIFLFMALEGLIRTGLITFNSRDIRIRPGHFDRGSIVVLLGDEFIYSRNGILPWLYRSIENSGRRWIDGSQDGYGPVEYGLVLEEIMKSYTPDMILLGYNVGNDLTDTDHQDLHRFYDRWHSIDRGLKAPQYIERMMKRLWRRLRSGPYKTNFMSDKESLNMVDNALVDPWHVNVGQNNASYLMDNIKIDGIRNQKRRQRVRESLEKIRELAQDIEAEVKIVLFPRSIQYSKELCSIYNRMNLCNEENIVGDRTHQDFIINSIEGWGWDYLDLLPLYSEEMNKLFQTTNDVLTPEARNHTSEWIAEKWFKAFSKSE